MSTLLTGVTLNCNASPKLIKIYKKILLLASKFPKDYAYRTNLEALICHNLSIVQESRGNREEIEDKIHCGSIESLIVQAEAECHLTAKMMLWRTWEPLIEQPPPGQWKWPPL